MNRIAPLCIAALLLCSCATKRVLNGDIFRVDRPWWDSNETYQPPEDCKDMLDLATYRFPEDTKKPPVAVPDACRRNDVGFTPKDSTIDPSDLAREKARTSAVDRDRLQDKLLALSNRECDEHHAAVVGTNSGTNFGLATLTSLFSGAATGFAAESTKTALAAISTFFGAARSHLNETIYRQLFIGTIIQAIDDDRQSVLLNIYDKRRYPVSDKVTNDPRKTGGIIEAMKEIETDTDDDKTETEITEENTPPSAVNALEAAETAPRLHYDVDEAIRDAEQYHDRCSFYQGLVRVAVTVQEASPCVTARQRRDQILDEITAMSVMTPTGDVQKAYETKKASLNKELEKLETKVQSCIDSSK